MNYLAIIFASVLAFQENTFATLVKEFESEHVKFIPFSEENRFQVAEILTNSDYYRTPYGPSTTESAQKKIDLHLKEQPLTSLSACLLFLKDAPYKAIGVCSFRNGNIFYNAEDAKKNPLNYIHGGGLRSSDYCTELGAGSIPILEEYALLKPEIMDALFQYAFTEDPIVTGISFGVSELEEGGEEYPMYLVYNTRMIENFLRALFLSAYQKGLTTSKERTDIFTLSSVHENFLKKIETFSNNIIIVSP